MGATSLPGSLRSPSDRDGDGPAWSLREGAGECALVNASLPEALRLDRADLVERAVTPAAARASLQRLQERLACADAAPLLVDLARCCADLAPAEPHEDTAGHWRRWRMLARLLEAAWPSAVGQASVDGETRLRLPLASRARFLVLSYPLRLAHPLPAEAEGAFGTADELAWRARRARDDWLEHLLRFQDRPMLAMRGSPAIDDDARLTVFNRRWYGGTDPGARLSLHAPSMDRVVADTVARDVLLPRFMLVDAGRLAARGFARPWRGLLVTLGWLLPLAACLGLLAVAGAAVASGRPDLAELALHGQFWLSVAAYGLVAVGVATVSPAVAHPVCLRVPAVSALGLVALLSLFAERLHLAGWGATAFLLALSAGYLLVEARNHDLSARAALARSLLTWLLGLAHATAVAAVVFTVLGGLLPDAVAGAMIHEQVSARWFAAAAGLALGVFLQVLWDERPITAPLSHLRWTDRLP